MESDSQLGIVTLPVSSWTAAAAPRAEWQEALESGAVLYCPALAFALEAAERRFLDARYADAKRKSIYLRGSDAAVHGTAAGEPDRSALARLLQRYQAQSLGLIAALFPGYAAALRPAATSFRPRPTGTGEESLSWRKDDTRLHVDAFPSNPTQGLRILRVFSNVGTAARVWRVGEPFEPMAVRFLAGAPRPSATLARLQSALGITKRVRSGYDHYMLQLHDRAKADLGYQAECPQTTIAFQPGSSWICFSDQVMHAAMAGQFMMEQTIHLPRTALAFPERAPAAILERLTGETLLPR